MKGKLLLITFILFMPLVLSYSFNGDYNNALTYSIADKRYCQQGGTCSFSSINVTTINNQLINGSLNISGNVYAYGFFLNDSNIAAWYVNHTSHIVYPVDANDKVCIGSNCQVNPFYKFTLEGGANITGNMLIDNGLFVNAITGNVQFYNNINVTKSINGTYIYENNSRVCTALNGVCPTADLTHYLQNGTTNKAVFGSLNVTDKIDVYDLTASHAIGADIFNGNCFGRDVDNGFCLNDGETRVDFTWGIYSSKIEATQFWGYNYFNGAGSFSIFSDDGFGGYTSDAFYFKSEIDSTLGNYPLKTEMINNITSANTSMKTYVNNNYVNNSQLQTNLSPYAKYNFTNNNFNGTGNFTTEGNINVHLANVTNLTVNGDETTTGGLISTGALIVNDVHGTAGNIGSAISLNSGNGGDNGAGIAGYAGNITVNLGNGGNGVANTVTPAGFGGTYWIYTGNGGNSSGVQNSGLMSGGLAGAFKVVGGNGGTCANTGTVTSTGGNGAQFGFTLGNGGDGIADGTHAAQGGIAGTYLVNQLGTAKGGDARTLTIGTNKGGSGGSNYIVGGNGGNAANGSTNTGGDGADFNLASGAGGRGDGAGKGGDFFLTTGNGGDSWGNPIAASSGVSGIFKVNQGNAGRASFGNTTNTGAASGIIQFLGGTGGAAGFNGLASSGGTVATGGVGSIIYFTAGTGGPAFNGGITQAGAGGGILFQMGSAGTASGVAPTNGDLRGGAGGSFTGTAGAGSATVSNSTSPKGGAGGSVIFTSGAGGDGTNNDSTQGIPARQGGNAGSMGFIGANGGIGKTNSLTGLSRGGVGTQMQMNPGNGGAAVANGANSAVGGSGAGFTINTAGQNGAGGAATTSTAGTNTGGLGFLFQLTVGVGGAASNSNWSYGGSSGSLEFLSNNGGAATSRTGGNATGGNTGFMRFGQHPVTGQVAGGAATGAGLLNIGGNGGDILFYGADGGSASGATTNIGGNGSSINFYAGLFGRGTQTNGTSGNINFYINSTLMGLFNTTKGSGLTLYGNNSLQLLNNATVWDDMIFTLTSSGGVPLSYTSLNNTPIQILSFSGTVANDISGCTEMPHSWRLESTIHPHIHIEPTTNAGGSTAVFNLTFLTDNLDGTLSKTGKSGRIVNMSNLAWNETTVEFDEINMAGYKLGTQVCFYLQRNTIDANDTYTGAIAIKQLSAHYEQDSLGSREKWDK